MVEPKGSASRSEEGADPAPGPHDASGPSSAPSAPGSSGSKESRSPAPADSKEPLSPGPADSQERRADLQKDGSGSGVAEFQRLALALGFGALVLALFFLLLVIYAPVVRPMLWAAALATLFFPMHRRLLRLLGGRETLAAAVSTVLTVLVFAVPVGFLFVNFLAQVQDLWPSVRAYLGEETFQRVAEWIQTSQLQPILERLIPTFDASDSSKVEAALRDAVSSFGGFLQNRLEEVGRDAPSHLLGAGVTLLIYFFFLRHGHGWLTQLEHALPLDPGHAANLLRIAGRTVNAVFRGVIITAAFQAVLAGLGFAVAGAPAPIVLGAITMVAALIPFVGPVAVWLPVAIGFFVTGHTGRAIGLFLWGTLVVSLVDNFLRPYLIGKETRIPILWLFLAIIGGISAFGLLGILLGPAALSLFLASYRIYMEGRKT